MESGSGERPPSALKRLRGLFSGRGAKPATIPVPSPGKIDSISSKLPEEAKTEKPQAPKGKSEEKAEKEPEPWFVVDGETRRLIKKETSKRELERIGLRKPIKLFTPEDGKKLLKALNQSVGDPRLVTTFVRSDGRKVEVKDYGTTGIIINMPDELTAPPNEIGLGGHIQRLHLGETAYLWAKLMSKLQGDVKLDTEGIIVETNKGYDFSAETKARVLKESIGNGKGARILRDFYSSLAEGSYPEGRKELGAEEGEALPTLPEPAVSSPQQPT